MTQQAQIARVLIVDDSPTFLEYMQHIINSDPGLEVVGQARDGEEALELVGRLHRGMGLAEYQDEPGGVVLLVNGRANLDCGGIPGLSRRHAYSSL